jgi:hypothetical protein
LAIRIIDIAFFVKALFHSPRAKNGAMRQFMCLASGLNEASGLSGPEAGN